MLKQTKHKHTLKEWDFKVNKLGRKVSNAMQQMHKFIMLM